MTLNDRKISELTTLTGVNVDLINDRYAIYDDSDSRTKAITAGEAALATFLADTGFTTGSIPFVGAGGILTEDNANLFWDNTNKWLGVGITPDSPLEIFGGSGDALKITGTAGVTEFEFNLAGGDMNFNATNTASRYLFKYGGSEVARIGNNTTENGAFAINTTNLQGQFNVQVNNTENKEGIRILNNDVTNDTAHLTIDGTSQGQAILIDTGTGSLGNGISMGIDTTGIFPKSTAQLTFQFLGSERFSMNSNYIFGVNSTGGGLGRRDATDALPTLLPRQNDQDTGWGGPTADTIVGTTGGTKALTIDASQNIIAEAGDIEVVGSANGVILESADGTRWRLQPTNSGVLTLTSL